MYMAYHLRRALPRLQSLAAQASTNRATLTVRHTASPSTSVASGALQNQQRTMASTHDVPKTMKGVIVEETGGVEVLLYKTDLPVPEPKENEILVKNEVCGINFIDTYFRTGLYPSKKPEILGREAAGHALTTSSANPHITAGQRVVYQGNAAYAEYTAVSADKVASIPEHVSLATACAAYLQGLTAVTLIDEAHHVKKGDWILVPAAAGGTGGLLCQLLKIRGAHTIATASTEEKRKLAKQYGAEVVVPYDQTLDAVKEHTGGKGVAAVFDGVGNATFDQSLQCVARKGTMVSFGNASGAVEPFSINRLAANNAKVARPTLFNYIKEEEEIKRYSTELWEAIGKEDGKGGPNSIQIAVHKTYPLSEIKQAHLDLEGRKTTGKLLLDPSK